MDPCSLLLYNINISLGIQLAKIFIATPMYGGVCHGIYTKSLISLIHTLQQNGHQVLYNDLYNESLINRARNTLTAMFLNTDADYLLFIDADQGFSAEGVLKMINEEEDVVGAAVPMKGIDWNRVKIAVQNNHEDLSKHTGIYNINFIDVSDLNKIKEDPQKLLEVSKIGTGLLLIKKNVLELMKDYVGTYKSDQNDMAGFKRGDCVYDFWKTMVDPESQRLLSEDYFFCDLWKKMGGKVYLAPYVKVVHAGTYIFQ